MIALENQYCTHCFAICAIFWWNLVQFDETYFWKFYECYIEKKTFTQNLNLVISFILVATITALFTNMQILKFKRRMTIAFFAAVNHLNGPLGTLPWRVQKVKVCDLWLVDFDPFCVFLCFKVRCLWSQLWLTAAKNAIVRAVFEL